MSVKHTVNNDDVFVVMDEDDIKEVKGKVVRFAGASCYILEFADGSEREVHEDDFLGKVIHGQTLRFDGKF